jgi:hypothetical protein
MACGARKEVGSVGKPVLQPRKRIEVFASFFKKKRLFPFG